MKLENLPKSTIKSKKRLGRGIGSGKGKTAARGYKGQKARGKVAVNFTGGGLPLYKKIPFLRGFARGGRRHFSKPVVLALSRLEVFDKGETVTIDNLIERKLVSKRARKDGVKILNNGEFNVALNIALPVSKGVAERVEKIGGKVV